MTARVWIDAHTPTLSAVDSRGLAVRNVGYHCHPLNLAIESRINRNQFDPAGRPVAAWDPRFWGTTPKANLDSILDLQGLPILVDSVDAGWQLSLLDQAGLLVSMWDGRGSQRRTAYDALLRPVVVVEQSAGERPRESDRFAYAPADPEFAARNQCGQLIRHDHPAGSRRCCEYGIGSLLLTERTRFLADLEPVDWSADSAEDRLEVEVFETSQHYSPAGEMRRQTDAMRNVRSFVYDRAGQLRETRLQLADSSDEPHLLVSEIDYDALGRSIREQAGNGIISTARFSDEDGRLLQLQSCHADGQALQDFHYGYDPVGNIIRIEDRAQPTSYFNNQRLDPVCCYVYDSLYQLIEATSCEVSQPSHGPALPTWQTTPLDPNQLRQYTQTFNYDAGGNLLVRHHSGAEKFEMFTALHSNRSVADKEHLPDAFDANGNQLELQRGQRMHWNIRNELSSVTLVKRDDGPDDTECYGYDQPGHRLRKVRCTQTAHRALRAEVRYLPGLEIHRDPATGEERHVVSVEAGRCHVRALHWVTKLPREVRNDQLRYSLSNHLNSSTLELDDQGAVLSREVYYPFGGTALWAGAGEIEAKYKTVRYSGKERDATGLYYYGYRYYAPWLQRWVSPDPAWFTDGLNLFGYVINNPLTLKDPDGLTGSTFSDFFDGSDYRNTKAAIGAIVGERQQAVLSASNTEIDMHERIYLQAYTLDAGPFVNDYLRRGKEVSYPDGYFPKGARVASDNASRIYDLVNIVDALPHTGHVTLYRGGSGSRGTSGAFFREGRLSIGDVLINTDFASFTENPIVAAEFAGFHAGDEIRRFDNTSVIFEVDYHFSPKPLAPVSLRSGYPFYESESLANPGAAFEITSVDLVNILLEGQDQSYVKVSLKEVNPPKITVGDGTFGSTIVLPDNVFDMRTGESVDFDVFEQRLGASSKQLLSAYY
ncbi:RHS repeat domain-containing protein [Pseudomonas sp. TMB3-21]